MVFPERAVLQRMFGVSIFAIAFIIIAGLSLYNKFLSAVKPPQTKDKEDMESCE